METVGRMVCNRKGILLAFWERHYSQLYFFFLFGFNSHTMLVRDCGFRSSGIDFWLLQYSAGRIFGGEVGFDDNTVCEGSVGYALSHV